MIAEYKQLLLHGCLSFLEGTAGYGTPAALAAPLLVALGFLLLLPVLLH